MPQIHETVSEFSGGAVPAAWTGCVLFNHDTIARTIELTYYTYESHAAAYAGLRPLGSVFRSIGPDRYDEFLQRYRTLFLALAEAADEFIAPELTGPVSVPPGPPAPPAD